MAMALTEADSLLELLRTVNDQLLALAVQNRHDVLDFRDVTNRDDKPDLDVVADLDAITEAVERRGQLVTRVGHLLRGSGSPHSPGAGRLCASTPTAYRAALEQTLDAGESAVQRILSLRQTIRSKLRLVEEDATRNLGHSSVHVV